MPCRGFLFLAVEKEETRWLAKEAANLCDRTATIRPQEIAATGISRVEDLAGNEGATLLSDQL